MTPSDSEQDLAATAPGIRVGTRPTWAPRPERRWPAHDQPRAPERRFVTESHVLGASIANPRLLFLAATFAVGLYLLGRRLSD